MAAEHYTTAVVILNYNGADILPRFLPSVLAHTPLRVGLFVADNGSTDGSLAYLQQFPRIQVIAMGQNIGYSKAYNQALARINATYYVLLNNDVAVQNDWITPLETFMNEHPEAGAIQPKLLAYLDKKMFEYAGACGGMMDKYFYPFCKGRVLDITEQDTQQYDRVDDIFWATGAAFFVRGSVFHQVKGLDEHLVAHQEEIELCWRIQRLGYRIYTVPTSVVYHLGAATITKNSFKKIYLNHRNSLIMISKNLHFTEWLPIVITKAIIELGVENGSLLFKGHFYAIRAITKAYWDYAVWLIKYYRRVKQDNAFLPEKKIADLKGVYRINLLVAYFIKRQKTFSELVQ